MDGANTRRELADACSCASSLHSLTPPIDAITGCRLLDEKSLMQMGMRPCTEWGSSALTDTPERIRPNGRERELNGMTDSGQAAVLGRGQTDGRDCQDGQLERGLAGKGGLAREDDRARVLLLIPHLGGGGAERVMARLARGLSPQRYEVHLGLMTGANLGNEAFPTGVQLHFLEATRVRSSALRLLRLVWRVRPRLILSGMAHLNFLVLLLRPLLPRGTRVLVRQNTTVSAVLAEGRVPFYTRWLYWTLYRRADRILCQSAAMARDLATTLDISPSKVRVLPNPLEQEAQGRQDEQAQFRGNRAMAPGSMRLLAVGRLAYEKGFDLLLEALVTVLSTHPNVTLEIAGTGPEEARLRALCRTLGLDRQVRFAGYVERPFAQPNRADIFVLSSRLEGMPNALQEAAVCGLPIVATPCSEGVVELLRGQPGVWLADQTLAADLARALLIALQSVQPGERYEHTFVEPFACERVMRAFEAILDAELAG